MSLPHGSKHPCAVLDEARVVAIKRALGEGRKQPALAVEFGVSRATINGISRGRNWKHVR